MKPVTLLVCFVASNAMALDFNTEWAKFNDDFARLKTYKVVKVDETKLAPVVSALEQVDPKSPDRLGHKLADPAMREKVTSLYKKPDTVVYSMTLE